MGGILSVCFTGGGQARRRNNMSSVLISYPQDEGLGHSFRYVRPDQTRPSSSKAYSEETTTFSTIYGASVSANCSTPLSTSVIDPYTYSSFDQAAALDCSNNFSSIPLQPTLKNLTNSGPIYPGNYNSGPLERGFFSAPFEKGFLSGPLERGRLFSGPIAKDSSDQFQRSFSYSGFTFRPRSRKGSLIRVLQRTISKTISRGQNLNSIVAPIKGVVKEPEWIIGSDKNQNDNNLTVNSDGSLLEDDDCLQSQNLQWARGKAGQDHIHVVVSEEHCWVFVGIYDGFNGPDAPDYLLSNLYSAVHKELKGLLWDDKFEPLSIDAPISSPVQNSALESETVTNCTAESCAKSVEFDSNTSTSKAKKLRSSYRGAAKRWEENQRKWKCEWDRERVELDRTLKEQWNKNNKDKARDIVHGDVLKALSQALKKTEDAYLDIADKMLMENPELALMGSCVLVMLMKGEDVYVMNVGDSRAVLAQKADPDYWLGIIRQDLERITEETLHDLEGFDGDKPCVSSLNAFQLSADHSTSVEKEVQRIKNEHPDDACAVMNDRVKGSLKVTRAFGAGFLKQPKWNNALLERFRIDYKGTSPYINCLPSLYHQKLGPKHRFLILSSDGLYQYFTNEEAVSEVELFIQQQPEGDPAQHLVEEVLSRAANKAGMDFHELLEIPQGDRRRYHDDVSIIVISLEGRIWRSFV